MHIPKKTTLAKVAAVALAGTMAVALSACGTSKPAGNTNNANENTPAQSSASANANAENQNAETNSNESTPVYTTLQNTFDAPGYLNQIPSLENKEVPRVADFTIEGIALTGNQHENAQAYANGYVTKGIMSEFNLNEWLYVYLPDSAISQLGADTSVIVLPHQDVETYKIAQKADLMMMAENGGGFTVDISPESISQEEGLNLVASGYVNMEAGMPRDYDVLICKGEIPAYYVVVNMLPATE